MLSSPLLTLPSLHILASQYVLLSLPCITDACAMTSRHDCLYIPWACTLCPVCCSICQSWNITDKIAEALGPLNLISHAGPCAEMAYSLIRSELCFAGWLDNEPSKVTGRLEVRPAAELGPIIVCLDTSGLPSRKKRRNSAPCLVSWW